MRISLSRVSILLIFSMATGIVSVAQNSLDPGAPADQASVITFEQDWKVADPQWYLIAINSSGESSYTSKALAKENESSGDPYQVRFIASAETRNKVFDLAKSLNNLQGNFETRAKVAQTGKKTLTLRQGAKETSTSLNYSDNQGMNQLIAIFQKISSTFELAQKLDYDIRFDKLGVDRELKNMERLDKENQLAELQVVAPMLERIANDNGIMNIARQRARRLLDKSRTENQQHQ